MERLPGFAPFVATSETSHAAALEIVDEQSMDRSRVYRFILERGARGATDDECQVILSMAGNTQRPRRVELVRMRLVIDSWIRRRTRSGRQAAVWIASSLLSRRRAPRRRARRPDTAQQLELFA